MTLTTVGYGDTAPATALGRVFGALTAVIGIGLVALLSGILASGFVEAFAREEGESPVDSPEEGSRGPEERACHERCPHCGGSLERPPSERSGS